ncbi:glycosyltransferase family 4 protein [Providencia sp.]|uniref:glycosyltransferase family 4 protein n=1 Tax=Providencia sp. TaxID=589 RepID=UPI003F9BCDF7
MDTKSSVIIHVVPSDVNAGPINVAKDLVYGLNNLNWSSSIFFLRDAKRKGLLHNFIKLTRMLKSKKIDVLHSHGIIPDLFCFILSFFFSFKWVSTIHADPQEDLKFLYPKSYMLICFLWQKILSRAEHAVYLTEYIYSKQQNHNKYFIHNSRLINPQLISEKLTSPILLKHKIGFCGVLIERKNVRNLVFTMKSIPEYTLLIAGDGQLRFELEENSKNYQNISFLGHQDDLTYFWDNIDILILPSFAEGVPLVAIEAIARGVPLILMNLDNYKNVFTESETFFISDLNGNTLSSAIKHIYQNYSNYHKNALHTYLKNFDYDDWVNKYIFLYKKHKED